MEAIVQNFFNVEIMARVLPYLLTGLGVTLLLSMLVVPLGLTGGLAVAVLYSLRLRWISVLVIAYVDFFRAFPPLVLLLFLYFGLPFFGVDIPAIVAVALGFLLNTSAYYGEIFRAGIDSIARGQSEAARSTGLSANDGIHHRTAGDEKRASRSREQHNGSSEIDHARERRSHSGIARCRPQCTGPHL
jgi:polar amino acid transport system permease protein